MFWGLGASKCKFLSCVVWFVQHGKSTTLNLGQMKLACAFCMKLVANVLCHVLDKMKKEPGQKELWFGNGNEVKWGS